MVALSRSDLVGSRFDTEGLERALHAGRGGPCRPPRSGSARRARRATRSFHLAAQTQVYKANRSPLETWETNVRGTYTAARGGARARTRWSGSSSRRRTRPTARTTALPYREEFALQPSYPVRRLEGRDGHDRPLLRRDLRHARRGHAAGERLRPGDVNWARVIPDTARALVRGERPVIRSDGTPERDYIYVEDAAEAYLAVEGSLERPAPTRAASGTPGPASRAPCWRSCSCLIEVSGQDVEPDIQGTGVPHGEIDRQFLDPTAIRGSSAGRRSGTCDAACARPGTGTSGRSR